MIFLYQFECKGIQAYIFGNRMRAMVGGSEIVEALTGSDLDEVLGILSLRTSVWFARRAGGAITAYFQDEKEARDFHDFWSFWVRSQYPGLSFVQAMVPEREGAEEELRKSLAKARNQATVALPLASPFAERAPRTGEPAVCVDPREQRMDAAMRAKIRKGQSSRLLQSKIFRGEEYFLPSLLVAEEGENEEEALFERDSGAWAAVVHIDGNSLGETNRKLKAAMSEHSWCERAKAQLEHSNKIEQATCAAARRAFRTLLDSDRYVKGKAFLAARPLVLGGDDVTFILRGSDALKTVEEFLRAFEEEMKKNGIPLTACAGIAFIKPEQPFLKAYQLAESLCKAAKRRLKEANLNTSALAFHRITTNMIDDWDTILERELSGPDGLQMTMQPYGLDPGKGLPALQDLRALEQALGLGVVTENEDLKETLALSKGFLRELVRALGLDRRDAVRALRRLEERLQKGNPEYFGAIRHCFQVLVGDVDRVLYAEHNSILPLIDNEQRSPLGDVMSLCALGGIE